MGEYFNLGQVIEMWICWQTDASFVERRHFSTSIWEFILALFGVHWLSPATVKEVLMSW